MSAGDYAAQTQSRLMQPLAQGLFSCAYHIDEEFIAGSNTTKGFKRGKSQEFPGNIMDCPIGTVKVC